MIVEKEVIRPGTYFYRDQKTGLPRKLVVTPELTRYWREQGNAMLSAGLTVPVPYEHDFQAHPMSLPDALKANAGWVKGYSLKGDTLYGMVDVTDETVAKKLAHTIRWTSPWINSFTDGNGKEWNNVISHLALTTRPRIVDQAPFGSVAAALSTATDIRDWSEVGDQGVYITRAGRLVRRKKDKVVCPLYPVAFSLYTGAALASDGMPPMKKGGYDDEPDMDALEDLDGGELDADDLGGGSQSPDVTQGSGVPKGGDVQMEELLCDLLGALGIQCEHTGSEADFKRNLYNAAMTKIHELAAKGQSGADGSGLPRANPPGMPPNAAKTMPKQAQQNPLIQQEQQPMYMSLEEIEKLPDPMRGVALAMYNENVRLRQEMEASRKTTNSLRDAKLKEASTARTSRVALLSKFSPRVKAELDAMLALPSMALSMGDGGAVVDPMDATLKILEKGLSDLPRLLTTDVSALSVNQQPTDETMMSDERSTEIADMMSRQMGYVPQSTQARVN